MIDPLGKVTGASSVLPREAVPVSATPATASTGPAVSPDRVELSPAKSRKIAIDGQTPEARVQNYFRVMDQIDDEVRQSFGKPVFKKLSGAPDHQAWMKYLKDDDPDAKGAIDCAKARNWKEADRRAGVVFDFVKAQFSRMSEVQPPPETAHFHQEGMRLAYDRVKACQKIVGAVRDFGSKPNRMNAHLKAVRDFALITVEGTTIVSRMESHFREEAALRQKFGLPS